VAATVVFGFASIGVGLIHAFAGSRAVDPAIKATLFARGVSEVVNCAALAILVGLPPLLPFVIGEVRRSRHGRQRAA
jgi:hypothetical protein